MKIISFEKLYNTDFFISEPMSKQQYWASRGNTYNSLGKPKISHTLIWFKNCSGTITDRDSNILNVEQNQLVYTAKGTEYIIDFKNTSKESEDTVVIHFQMTNSDGEDICPTLSPVVCIKDVDSSLAMDINMLAEEFKKNVVCIPRAKSTIYNLLTKICRQQKKNTTKHKYACIRTGIELLEKNSNLSISEIAEKCGVSECYFRRLFEEYSGESPMNFRQHHRIEKAKQLMMSDEQYTIGEIAQELNFSDIYHFSKTFKKYCGVSPNKFLQSL